MKRGIIPALVLAFICAAPPSLSGDRPIIAVFDVQTKRLKLSGDILDALADYLASMLTEKDKYQVVPRNELKKRQRQAPPGARIQNACCSVSKLIDA
jgi:hypothetical protein